MRLLHTCVVRIVCGDGVDMGEVVIQLKKWLEDEFNITGHVLAISGRIINIRHVFHLMEDEVGDLENMIKEMLPDGVHVSISSIDALYENIVDVYEDIKDMVKALKLMEKYWIKVKNPYKKAPFSKEKVVVAREILSLLVEDINMNTGLER